MSRWIDADALECDTEWSDYEDDYISYSKMQIACAPSIDIVRCKECKWYNTREGCFFSTAEIEPNDFCSNGEPSDDECKGCIYDNGKNIMACVSCKSKQTEPKGEE